MTLLLLLIFQICVWDPQGVPGPQVKNHCVKVTARNDCGFFDRFSRNCGSAQRTEIGPSYAAHFFFVRCDNIPTCLVLPGRWKSSKARKELRLRLVAITKAVAELNNIH